MGPACGRDSRRHRDHASRATGQVSDDPLPTGPQDLPDLGDATASFLDAEWDTPTGGTQMSDQTTPIPDAMEAAPDVHEVLLDNDRVRVLAYDVEPGDRAELHSHPDSVIYHLDGTSRPGRPHPTATSRSSRSAPACACSPRPWRTSSRARTASTPAGSSSSCRSREPLPSARPGPVLRRTWRLSRLVPRFATHHGLVPEPLYLQPSHSRQRPVAYHLPDRGDPGAGRDDRGPSLRSRR